MKTKYLTINNKPVEIGTKYWRVNLYNNYQVLECTAGNENNIISACYFHTKLVADSYSAMKQLQSVLNKQIDFIEEHHRCK